MEKSDSWMIEFKQKWYYDCVIFICLIHELCEGEEDGDHYEDYHHDNIPKSYHVKSCTSIPAKSQKDF